MRARLARRAARSAAAAATQQVARDDAAAAHPGAKGEGGRLLSGVLNSCLLGGVVLACSGARSSRLEWAIILARQFDPIQSNPTWLAGRSNSQPGQPAEATSGRAGLARWSARFLGAADSNWPPARNHNTAAAAAAKPDGTKGLRGGMRQLQPKQVSLSLSLLGTAIAPNRLGRRSPSERKGGRIVEGL